MSWRSSQLSRAVVAVALPVAYVNRTGRLPDSRLWITRERPRKAVRAAMMEGMAGLEGVEQPRQRADANTSRWLPVAEDEQALKALELFGNPTEGEVRLPSRPESAATARRLAQCVLLRQWGLSPQTTEHTVLLVSELVGNAVRHTGARVFGLRMLRRRGWIRIEVRDPSRGLPCLMPVQAMDTSGRGLFLVDKLSDRWGVDLLPRGKNTWFEMRVADRQSP